MINIRNLRRAKQAIKRQLIQHLGMVSDQRFFLDAPMQSQRNDVERICEYCGPVDINYINPANNSLCQNVYPRRFIYSIPEAIIDPVSGLVYDRNGQYVAESSAWAPLRQMYSWPQPRIKIPSKKVSGCCVYLPSIGYYHWLIEDLPPFLRSMEVASTSRIIAPRSTMAYVEEVLCRFDNEIIRIDGCVQVERLIMTGKTAGLGNPIHGLTPHPEDVATLRRFFKQYISPSVSKKKLYLSRRGQIRSPRNEAVLQENLERLGFEPFSGAGMALSEQVTLFSEAESVIGIHGAAFSNIVWMNSSAKICEVFPTEYIPSCYAMLSSIRNCEYEYVGYDNVEQSIDAISLENIMTVARSIC